MPTSKPQSDSDGPGHERTQTHESHTRLDRALPKDAKVAPMPDVVVVVIAVAATVLGVLLLVQVLQAGDDRPAGGGTPGREHDSARFPAGSASLADEPATAGDLGMTIHARMMSFSLPTQHGDTVHITFPRRRPVVLAFADRQGAEQIDEWVRPLRSRYAHMYGRSLDVQGVADLSEVPALARPLAMLLIRERVAYPVALDWHGEVCRILAVADGQITLFVVAADGHIRLRLAGRATASRLQQLADAIDDVLPAAQP